MKGKWVDLRDGLYDLSKAERVIFHNEHKVIEGKKDYEYVYGLSITLIYPNYERTIDYKKQERGAFISSHGNPIRKKIISYQNDPERREKYDKDVLIIKKALEVF